VCIKKLEEKMDSTFSEYEIVELGIQIEKNGRDFYNGLVAKSDSQKARDIFKYLAGEEEKHIAVFREILSSVRKYEPPGAYPEEYFAYMNALAGDYVFTQKDKGAEIAAKTKSDMEAVELGIKFEEESIVFYEGIKKVVPEEEHRLIDKLIEQEQDHLRQLLDVKKKLKSSRS
jgi:rubrerythrin